MTPVVSRLPLVLLLLAAGCILGGGVVLSRREQTVRTPREREPLRQQAAALQKELLRLEALHQNHLRDLCLRLAMGESVRTQQECENIVGVVACTFLPRNRTRAEEHVRVGRGPAGAYPTPTFEAPSLARADLRVLDAAVFGDPLAPLQGWLEDPGWPLLYWHQSPKGHVVFLTIESRDVQQATSGWLRSWLQGQPAFARLLQSGSAQLLGPDGKSLDDATAHAPDPGSEPPHWSQALATRYGNWHLVSWDKVETRLIHHAPTLLVAGALSVMVALLGIFIHHQQRRAGRLAAQRVSFVNRVSHELRTPLTNMMLNLDVIGDALPEDARHAGTRLALVREEAARLARLIENVLTFSRAEQGLLKMHATLCRPREVVDAVAAQFATGFARRDITVVRSHMGDDTPCVVDADALSQITANLLSNVEKYAPGVPVQVRTLRRETRLELAVSDDGPGIPPTDASRIFTPFVRLDDRVTAGVTGTGLGLSIARELAERMGGTLRLETEGNVGACFILEVPVSASPGPSAPSEGAPPSPPSPARTA